MAQEDFDWCAALKESYSALAPFLKEKQNTIEQIKIIAEKHNVDFKRLLSDVIKQTRFTEETEEDPLDASEEAD